MHCARNCKKSNNYNDTHSRTRQTIASASVYCGFTKNSNKYGQSTVCIEATVVVARFKMLSAMPRNFFGVRSTGFLLFFIWGEMRYADPLRRGITANEQRESHKSARMTRGSLHMAIHTASSNFSTSSSVIAHWRMMNSTRLSPPSRRR